MELTPVRRVDVREHEDDPDRFPRDDALDPPLTGRAPGARLGEGDAHAVLPGDLLDAPDDRSSQKPRLDSCRNKALIVSSASLPPPLRIHPTANPLHITLTLL